MSSQKFKLTVIGVMPGHCPDKVKIDVGCELKLMPSDLDALLSNESPEMAYMVHKDAWKLKQVLHQKGVDCRISAIPIAELIQKKKQPSFDIQEESLGLLTEMPVATSLLDELDIGLEENIDAEPERIYSMSPARVRRFAYVAGCLLVAGWWYSHSNITLSEEGKEVSVLVAKHLR